MIRLDEPGGHSKRKLVLGVEKKSEVSSVIKACTPNILRSIRIKGLSDSKDDLFQDIVLAVLEKHAKGEIENIRAYIFGITRNIIAAACKRRNDKRSMETSFLNENFDDCKERLMNNAAIRAEIEKERTNFLTSEALNIIDIHLSKEQARVLKGFYLEGKSHSALANEFGKTEVNIRKIKSRGMEKLKLLLRPKC